MLPIFHDVVEKIGKALLYLILSKLQNLVPCMLGVGNFGPIRINFSIKYNNYKNDAKFSPILSRFHDFCLCELPKYGVAIELMTWLMRSQVINFNLKDHQLIFILKQTKKKSI